MDLKRLEIQIRVDMPELQEKIEELVKEHVSVSINLLPNKED